MLNGRQYVQQTEKRKNAKDMSRLQLRPRLATDLHISYFTLWQSVLMLARGI
jgi:hypothetical protein